MTYAEVIKRLQQGDVVEEKHMTHAIVVRFRGDNISKISKPQFEKIKSLCNRTYDKECAWTTYLYTLNK